MSKMDVDGSYLVGLDTDPRVCRCIPLTEVDNAVLLGGLALWQGLKGERRYPPRSAITPRVLKPILRNTALLRVMNGGEDYEYRIVGDAYVMAHSQSFQGKRWSEMGDFVPSFHRFVKQVYDRVVQGGDPVAMRGWIERGRPSIGHVYCEYIYLPLGEAATGVDHILAVAVYLRNDGHEHFGETQSSFTI
jgi:hypothetical protein